MTSPGGNDEVIRVVYQAVADYSQLIRETRRAREQTAALKRDIDGLAGTTTAKVRVEADTSRARTELAALVRDAVIRARVVLDAAAARSELAGLVRDLIVKARIVVDAAAAKAELARATRDTTTRVRIQTDGAGLAALAAQLAQIRDLVVRVTVKADTAGLASLRAQLARLRDLTVTVAAKADTGSLAALRAELATIRDLAVRVGVTVDDGALAALRTRLAALRDRTIKVGVRVDALALARLSSLLAGLDGVAGDNRSVGLDVTFDFAGVEARFRALLAHLESLGPVRLNVELDRSIFDRIAELERAIAALRNSGGGGGGGAGGAGAGIAEMLGSLNPAGLATMVAKVVAIGAAATAVIPIVAALAAIIGGAAAAALAAGSTFAIFAVGAVGAMAKVTEAVQAFEKSGTVATGPIGQVVSAFEELKARYAEFQAATSAPVFGVFTHGLQLAADLLDKVQDLVADSAGAIDDAMSQVQAAIDGAGFDDFLTFIGEEGPAAVAGFTTGLLGFVGGIGDLIQAFQPLIDMIVGGFASAGQAFAAWAADLENNQGFQDFLSYATAQIPKVIDLVGTLITAGASIVEGLAPAGSALLDIVNAVADVLAAIPPDFWAGFSSSIVVATPLILDLLDGLVGLLDSINDIDAGLDVLGDKFDAFCTAVQTAAKVLAASNPLFAGLAAVIGVVAGAANTGGSDDGGGGDKPAPMVRSDAATRAAVAAVKAGAAIAAAGPDTVQKRLQADFGSDKSTSMYNTATAAADAYAQQVKAVQDAEKAHTDAVRAATRAQEDLSQARKDAAQRVRDLQRSLRDMTLDERQANLSVKGADDRLNKLIQGGGTADEIEQAKIDAERAHNALSDLKQDKGDKKSSIVDELAKGTAGNRALQDAVAQNATAQQNLTLANTNLTTASKKLVDLHLAFQTAAGALGLTEGQVKKLRDRMDALKVKTVKVVLHTKDAEAALTKLLQGQYALQLLAANPTWGLDKAMAEAAKQVPSAAAAAGTKAPAADSGNLNPNVNPGHAAGGPTTASPVTAGAVYGPGTGTSDSIAVRLPVGGPSRLSFGEHIVTDAEVKAAPGGHGYLEAFRAGLRARRPWGPPGYRTGGPATLPVIAAPVFRMAALPSALPGYAAGGAAAGYRAGATHVDRSVTVNVGTITNAVPETAGDSLYRQVRKAVDGDL